MSFLLLRTIAAAVAVLLVGATGCGGGSDDCDGFVSINGRPEECNARAEALGCSTVEIDGPSCGLFGCVRCDSNDDS